MFPNLGKGLFSFMEKQTQHNIEYLIRQVKTQVDHYNWVLKGTVHLINENQFHSKLDWL